LDEDEVDENKAHKRSLLTSKKDKIASKKHTTKESNKKKPKVEIYILKAIQKKN
jgi:hypothetical protein